ncbi:hypothetical protein HOK68_02790 [Candidatus Woesearchaeota archaeon]|jgi:hypothetical protein|nr:hypothetical protein [Candidatus Woesearchaeota archaeon]MBT4387124.1 hypothetical protein [Candidatus Woesearchaeota archaeon]MBT4596119.1 hypothetical protein [Candidatus Woesearchaeota archaeon]MBT5741658.1 hypothetical protein [Candidatus Woesearchaeota archaeon]MBT6505679.1 hypothetical protein [Candidatus Woesearchaeota archaeon]
MKRKGSIELSMNAIVVIILSITIMVFGFFIIGKIFQLEKTIDISREKTTFDFDGILGVKQNRFEVTLADPVIVNFGIVNQIKNENINLELKLNNIYSLLTADSTNPTETFPTFNEEFQTLFSSTGTQKQIIEINDLKFREKRYIVFAINNVKDFKKHIDSLTGGQDNKFFILEFALYRNKIIEDNRKYNVYINLK